MKLVKSRLALTILFIAALYFIIEHRPPLPLSHEAVGLGTNHLAHSIFGVLLLAGAGVTWYISRGKKK